jgi:hypothetical protein
MQTASIKPAETTDDAIADNVGIDVRPVGGGCRGLLHNFPGDPADRRPRRAFVPSATARKTPAPSDADVPTNAGGGYCRRVPVVVHGHIGHPFCGPII